jgi:hypothetical protein
VIKTYILAIKRIFQDHGIKGFLVILEHSREYIWYKFVKKGEFMFNGKDLEYFYHWYGHTYRSERIVEIPIVRDFLEKYEWKVGKKILEIGDVLSHYLDINLENHDIVDKYADDNVNVVNEDVVSFSPNKKYDLIVSISTIEHVGWDENPKKKDKFLEGINNMLKLLKPSGRMLCEENLV